MTPDAGTCGEDEMSEVAGRDAGAKGGETGENGE